MSEKSEVKACPKCHQEMGSMPFNEYYNRWYAECGYCGHSPIEGEPYTTHDDALKAWNSDPTEPEPCDPEPVAFLAELYPVEAKPPEPAPSDLPAVTGSEWTRFIPRAAAFFRDNGDVKLETEINDLACLLYQVARAGLPVPEPAQGDWERARLYLSGFHVELYDGINRADIEPQKVIDSLAAEFARVRAEATTPRKMSITLKSASPADEAESTAFLESIGGHRQGDNGLVIDWNRTRENVAALIAAVRAEATKAERERCEKVLSRQLEYIEAARALQRKLNGIFPNHRPLYHANGGLCREADYHKELKDLNHALDEVAAAIRKGEP